MGLLPKPPSLNAIKFLIHDPCETPWWVYVKTAIPAAGASLWMLIVPQPEEILEQYLDPSKTRGQSRRKFQRVYRRFAFPGGGPGAPPPGGPPGDGPPGGGGGGGPRTAGGAAARRGKIGALFDSNTTIAERLPGRQLFESRKISLTEHVFWTGFNTLERVQWYFLIYSAGTNFIYEWTSGIFEASCKFNQPASGRWFRSEFDSQGNNIAPVREDHWDRLYLRGEGTTVDITRDGDIVFHFPMKVTFLWSAHAKILEGIAARDVTFEVTMDVKDGPDVQEKVTKHIEINGQVTHTFAITHGNVTAIRPNFSGLLDSLGRQWGDVSFISEPM